MALTSEAIVSFLLESTALCKWICDTEREKESVREKEPHSGRNASTEKYRSSRGTRKSFIPQEAAFEQFEQTSRRSISVPCNILGNLLIETVDEGNGVGPRDVAAGDGRVQLKSETPQHRVHQQRQSHYLKCKMLWMMMLGEILHLQYLWLKGSLQFSFNITVMLVVI